MALSEDVLGHLTFFEFNCQIKNKKQSIRTFEHQHKHQLEITTC